MKQIEQAEKAALLTTEQEQTLRNQFLEKVRTLLSLISPNDVFSFSAHPSGTIFLVSALISGVGLLNLRNPHQLSPVYPFVLKFFFNYELQTLQELNA